MPGRYGVLLVTGAAGFLGRHLLADPGVERWTVVAPPSTALDVRRRDATIGAIRDAAPRCVVHLAYRRDDRSTIVDGSRHVAEAAVAAGASLIHLSTDLVFGGRTEPYVEADDPDPTLPYGVAKRDAERAVADNHPDATIVRTSVLYGTGLLSPGQRDLPAHLTSGTATMTFFTDEFRCPTHAADLAAALVDLAGWDAVDRPAGPLHVAAPEVVSRADLASRFARHLGLDPTAVRTGTIAESGLERPCRIVLDATSAAGRGLGCRPLSDVLA